MRRRDVLAGVSLAAGAPALGFPAPAIAQGIRRLSMVTDYPDGPGMLPSARRLARTIEQTSHGRIRIEVTPGGAVVKPLQTFDAVQAGIADMFHSHIGYFDKKSPAFHFFSGVPFGLTANELFAWVRFGGGQELWDALAGQFEIKPFLACSTGSQMGGWFTREITSPDDFKGLRYRMGAPAGEVFRRLGAIVVLVPGAEIVSALQSGAIEACEWIGPWMDMAMGLHKAAGFYYYPSWNEPGGALALGIARRVWESFDDADRQLIETAAASEFAVSLAQFNAGNARALRALRAEGAVRLMRYPDALLRTFAEIARDVVADIGSRDDSSKKIYASYQDFLVAVRDWSDIGEGAYLSMRMVG